MLPTFLVIGAQKCGTTSLASYLGAHPQVFVTRNKEPNFFDAAENWPRGVAWYEGLFADAAGFRARGEASTNYTKAPHVAGVPERIAQVVPDVKLVYIVRNPIDRIRSQFVHRIDRLRETPRPITEAVAENPEYLDYSRYAFQLDRYLEHFARDRLLVVSSERLLTDRVATLREVLTFVGADPHVEGGDVGEQLNRSEDKARPAGPVLAVRNIVFRTPLYGRIPRPLRRGLRSLSERKIDPALAVVPATLEAELWAERAPDLARLREIVGPDFDLWGHA